MTTEIENNSNIDVGAVDENVNDENKMIIDNNIMDTVKEIPGNTKKRLKALQQQEEPQQCGMEDFDVDSSDDDDDNKKSKKDKNKVLKCSKTGTSPLSSARSTTTLGTPSSNETFSPELLKMYYSRLFPFELLYSWLNYRYDPTSMNSAANADNNNTDENNKEKKGTKLFSCREFSFTIEPIAGEEIYLRYQSFSNKSELMNSIIKKNPIKIDIGAVFTIPPKDGKGKSSASSISFQPTQRELVFDIDLTDYDDIRCCGCKNANICNKCWIYMTCAIQVIDIGLKEDFGFKHIAWFYSGRRGVHCWICDESARKLTNEGRNAVASYFEVELGNERNNSIGSLPSPIHPMLQRSYAILEPMFIKYIIPSSGHGLLATDEKCEELLNLLPDFFTLSYRELIESKWKSNLSPIEKWEKLKQIIRVATSGKSKSNGTKAPKIYAAKEKNQLENWPYEIVFKYTYPRLDINVSKTMNHLLKSPFCVHPKTGRVCVPMQVDEIQSFDPFQVPTLSQVINELDDAIKKEDNNENDKNKNKNNKILWQKTSLKQYFQPFKKQFLEPMLKEIHREERQLEEEKAAIMGDF